MPTEFMAAYLEYRENQLLDAVVAAAALMARADGALQPVERHHLVDVLASEEFLFVFTREEILEAFERKLGELRRPNGLTAVVDGLRGFAGRPAASLVIAVAEEIAAADCRLHQREERMLRLIRIALSLPASAAAPNRTPARAARGVLQKA